MTTFYRNSVPLKLSLGFPKLSWAHSQPFLAYTHHNTNIPNLAHTFLLHKRPITNHIQPKLPPWNSAKLPLNQLLISSHTHPTKKHSPYIPPTFSLRILVTTCCTKLGFPLSLHIMPNNSLFITMQPLIFTYCFTIGGYNVFKTFGNFSSYWCNDGWSIVDPIEQNTQEIPEVNTSLNLFNNWI